MARRERLQAGQSQSLQTRRSSAVRQDRTFSLEFHPQAKFPLCSVLAFCNIFVNYEPLLSC